MEVHDGRFRAESAGPGRTRPVGLDNGPPPVHMVVDDVRMLRLVRDVLAEPGYAPLAPGKPEGLPRIVRTENPRQDLLDLVLSVADGIELIETLPELADIPVIFISACERDETIAPALENDAADCLAKPFLCNGADRADPGGAAKAGRAGDLRARRFRRRLPGAAGYGGRAPGAADRHRVLAPAPAHAECGPGLDLRVADPPTVGKPGGGDADRVRTFIRQLQRKLGDDKARPRRILNERGVGCRVPGPEG